jgi:hypothetical protein
MSFIVQIAQLLWWGAIAIGAMRLGARFGLSPQEIGFALIAGVIMIAADAINTQSRVNAKTLLDELQMIVEHTEPPTPPYVEGIPEDSDED